MKNVKQLANAFSRSQGYGLATSIIVGNSYKIVERVRPGYRKLTTDEYVPNKYILNFGWKNTYYQPAKTVVQVPFDVVC